MLIWASVQCRSKGAGALSNSRGNNEGRLFYQPLPAVTTPPAIVTVLLVLSSRPSSTSPLNGDSWLHTATLFHRQCHRNYIFCCNGLLTTHIVHTNNQLFSFWFPMHHICHILIPAMMSDPPVCVNLFMSLPHTMILLIGVWLCSYALLECICRCNPLLPCYNHLENRLMFGRGRFGPSSTSYLALRRGCSTWCN